MNREKVLKDFLDKIKKAKQYNMSEIRISIKELDDIMYIIYELMSEKISDVLDNNNTNTISGGSF